MTGSMIIKGARSGKSVILTISPADKAGAAVEVVKTEVVPATDALYLDAIDALNLEKSRPSVNEGEVNFLSAWLKLAYAELTKPILAKSEVIPTSHGITAVKK